MLIVRLYGNVPSEQKPAGIPDEWPAEVQLLPEMSEVPKGWIEMSDEELAKHKEANQGTYDAWRAEIELPSIKDDMFSAIDVRTAKLIEEGFEFQEKRFSLSLNAQSTYSGLYMIRQEKELAYPVNVNTIDDLDSFQLADAAGIRAFYLTAVSTYRSHLDSGTELKNAVRKASTAAEVSAVVDSR